MLGLAEFLVWQRKVDRAALAFQLFAQHPNLTQQPEHFQSGSCFEIPLHLVICVRTTATYSRPIDFEGPHAAGTIEL